MAEQIARSRGARLAAEAALVSVVFHYGSRPEFVLLGGLVPELLCMRSRFLHAGTTDVDVQLDLEISCGSVNVQRLEKALLAASFAPDSRDVWRWSTGTGAAQAVIKFEMLADRDDEPSDKTIVFAECENLGAANLRGTGFAARDFSVRPFRAAIDGRPVEVEINVTGLGGFLCAKTAAAQARSLPKDWYDVAFVLLHNDAGGPEAACEAVAQLLDHGGASLRFQVTELQANFARRTSQGTIAYVQQMLVEHPELASDELAADAMVAVQVFHDGLVAKSKPRGRSMSSNDVAGRETPGTSIDEREELAASLRDGLKRNKDEPILLCVPMWGHEGDGKTTSLLTAVHYADVVPDGIGLRYVNDPDLLNGLEAQEQYQALNLRSRATATRKELGEAQEEFFHESSPTKPHGTDRGSYHLLELDNTVGAVAFCLFPDLPGGTYRENDDESRSALKSSHAWGVLVDAVRYMGSGTKAKNYRDGVRALIQRAVRQEKPFCVMITKADLHEGHGSAVDAAAVELTSFIGQLNTSVSNLILKTSVTGIPWDADGPPPPVPQRRPRNVVRAYAWLIDQALKNPEKIRAVVPVTSKTPAPAAVTLPAFIPELRRVTEQSGARGRPLCDCSDDPQKRLVAFVQEDASVTEVTVPMRTGAEPSERAIGTLSGLEVPLADLQAEYLAGELILGARRNPKCLWVGKKGDLRKTDFGIDISGWSPISPRRIVGVDAGGRAHILKLSADLWRPTDTVADLAPSGAKGGACQVVSSNRVCVGSGDVVISLAIESEGFGPRTATTAFPGAGAMIGNRRGLLCSVVTSGDKHTVGVFDGAAYHELGPAKDPTIALAHDGNLLAWSSPDGKLTAAIVSGTERATFSEPTTEHPGSLEALCWTSAGEALIALFEKRTWAVFVPKGVGR